MMRRSKLSAIIKSKSGVSLIIVLCFMIIPLLVSVSVLTAAGASSGAGTAQKVYNQLNLYSDAIQKSILYSIQKQKYADDTNKNPYYLLSGKELTLGGQILRMLYTHADTTGGTLKLYVPNDSSTQVGLGITMTDIANNPLPEGTVLNNAKVFLAFKRLPVKDDVILAKPAILENDPSNLDASGNQIQVPRPAIPKHATINALMNVVVEVTINNKTMTSISEYELMSGYVEESDTAVIQIKNSGDWRLLKYEKTTTD